MNKLGSLEYYTYLCAMITETITGYLVKDLKWNARDNIYVGLVKCPILGSNKLHEGYICCQWKRNGLPTNRFKGKKDLTLKIEDK